MEAISETSLRKVVEVVQKMKTITSNQQIQTQKALNFNNQRNRTRSVSNSNLKANLSKEV